jgi:glycerol kinase
LESVGFQTRDLAEAMRADWAASGAALSTDVLRVDGGMSASDPAMQFLSDILGAPVDRPRVLETTALGAAWLAGQAAGIMPGATQFADRWALDRRFEPAMTDAIRDERYAGWKRAVQATITAAG